MGAALASGPGSVASAQTRWTPADNNGIAATQGFLTGSHISASIAGVAAPGMLGLPFELVAYGTDIGLKNTPALLYLPGDLTVDPNHTATGGTTPLSCVYKFRSAIPNDARESGIEADFGGIFFVPYRPLPNVWGDLGAPTVYHPHAAISVSVDNPYLSRTGYGTLDDATRALLAKVPEFPEGRHLLDWEAATSMNVVLDVAVPGVLIAGFAFAEYQIGSKVAAEATKQSAKKWDRIATAASVGFELGLIGVDVGDAFAANEWYKDTSVITAINEATQTLTVWDTHVPYIRDNHSGAVGITQQNIQLEATDFGGVRFSRVADALRARFDPIDSCGRPFQTTALTPASTLLKVGPTPNVITWEAREIDGGPYKATTTLGSNQQLGHGGNIVTTLAQRVTVVDTQAPILVPPPGFARYSATPINLATAAFPLGRPLVVDLADPAPTVTSNAPDVLDVNHRYIIDWRAADDSGNTTPPAQQIVTIKSPGTNTVPTAQGASAATLTSQPVEVQLVGVDTDLIDGRVDPLAFEIEDYPPNGQFEAPLLPYFIEDFRLSPVGERDDERTLTRTSPLGSLAAAFAAADPQTHGTFLTNQICNAAPGSANHLEFNRKIPVNFVYEPTYVHVDDEGFYFIRDKFWVCGEPNQQYNRDIRPTLSPIPRLSKWTNEGELVAMRALLSTVSPDYADPWSAGFPTDDFSVDHEGRLWVELGGFFTAGGSIAQFHSFDQNLADQRFHGSFGSNEQELTSGEWLVRIAGDSRLGLLYELRRNGDCGFIGPPCTPDYAQHSLVVRVDTADLTAEENVLGRIPLRGLDDTDATGLAFEYIDVKVDSRGNVYVLDGNANRIHKFSPTVRNDAGVWEMGEHIGWLGSCSANLLDSEGVPFNDCDEVLGVSRGYACTDTTCARGATTSGTDPGKFNAPRSIEIDPRDILYVADTGNSRVQRFGPDGTFAGEAKSTGSGVNQGDDPGFILGNMGEPKQLAVNSSSFYVMEPDPQNGDNFVHVFKTLPFYDVTDASAKVKYVSTFDYQGADAFTYVVNDGIDRSAPAPVNVNVARAFRPPDRLASQCFADVSLTGEIPCNVPEDGQIVVRISARDLDGFVSTGGLDTLTFSILDQPAHGTLAFLSATDNAAVYRYSPAANYNGLDALSFEAFDGAAASAEKKAVKFTVVPTPDPVAIEFPDNIRGARGFPLLLSASYSDLDADSVSAPTADALQWGDGTTANAPGWAGSGRRDPNGRDVSPQEGLGLASGLLIGSHVYASTGNYTVSARMKNAAAENLPDTTATGNVEVIEATVVGAELVAPAQAVNPDTVFPLMIDVANLVPQTWAGLTAGDTEVALKVPEGLALVTLDPRCDGTTVVTCTVGDLSPGETASLALSARIALEAARTASVYSLEIEITDAGPKAQPTNLAVLTLQVADADGDGAIDVDDAFPEDPLYAVDTDGDGLPDGWETAHGFDAAVADATAVDIDGDGLTLAEEFAAGSYPLLGERQTAQPGPMLEAGGTAANGFGFTISGGDLNQDGYADTVIGAPGHAGVGAAFIAYGSANGAIPSLVRIDPSDGLTGFGRTLAVADLDGNGYPEIAIGSNNAVSIHVNNGRILSTPDLVLNGPAGQPNAGYLAAGDLDGDGAADLVAVDDRVGANGLVSIYFSRRGFAAPVTFTSSSATFGQSAAIADVDGDGRLDLLVGTLGEVHGFLAAHNDWQTASALTLSFVLSDAGPTTYGFSIASGADIGGDGIADLVVGKYGGAGQVFVYDSATQYWDVPTLGATSTVAASQTLNGGDDGSQPGDGFGDQFGVRLALGHLDTDGFADLVVGGNRAGLRDAGQIEIYRGSAGGLQTPPQVEPGATDRDMLGYFVAIPGDVNGDGVADVAAGAPEIGTTQNPTPGPGYARIYEHAFVAIDSAEDPDGDGVRTALDNCPLVANTERADLDGDGSGDACDTDADGDGIANAGDNCPLVASLDQTNSDTDGQGNLCDEDDDNDDVADANDPFPTDARYTADTDGDGMPDEYESAHGLSPSDAADALADADGDGRNNLAEFLAGTDVDADDVAPVVTAPADIVVNSIGPYTAVTLGAATAADAKDGALAASPSTAGPFAPGRHVIEWRAVDAAGNEGMATQQVDVIPRVDFAGAAQYTGEGVGVFVTAMLNGAPVSYPVSVPYMLGGTAADGADYFVSGTLEIASGRSATLNLTIASDTASEGQETIIVTMGEPTNAVAGNTTEHVVNIIETNLAPFIVIKVAQAGGGRSPIVAGDGAVRITVGIGDPNPGDSHTIDWSQTDNALVPSEGFGSESFTFDPAGVAPGVYGVRVRVADSGGSSVTAVRFVRVVAAAPVLATGVDSDGDGVDDATEGLADVNQNGISDYLEATSESYLLTAVTGGRGVLQARPGLALVLGATALASGLDATVTLADVANYGDNGGPALNANDGAFDYPAGIYDFELRGLAKDGDSAEIVIALPSPLPAGASYRKYVAPAGWGSFETDARNAVASAPGALDACPAPGSAAYVPGLNAGDYCVQLTIEDGGPNDADGLANRGFRDPGGAAVAYTPPVVTVTTLTASSRTVAAGTADVVVARFRVHSDSADIVMNSLALTASGSGNDNTQVVAVELWVDTNGDGAVDAADVKIGNGVYATDNGSLTLQLTAPRALPAGSTDFLVTYDF